MIVQRQDEGSIDRMQCKRKGKVEQDDEKKKYGNREKTNQNRNKENEFCGERKKKRKITQME